VIPIPSVTNRNNRLTFRGAATFSLLVITLSEKANMWTGSTESDLIPLIQKTLDWAVHITFSLRNSVDRTSIKKKKKKKKKKIKKKKKKKKIIKVENKLVLRIGCHLPVLY